jgi:stalled ribosome rescue protein Dom34
MTGISMDVPEKEAEKKEDLTGLYDLAVPLGMPVSVIREMVDEFDLDLVRRAARMDMTGEVMDREILVFRGDLETIMAAKEFMFKALDRKMAEWGSKDKAEKYKKFYDDQVKARLKELKENPESAQSWDLPSSGTL